jgi:sialidase-1
MRHLFTLISIAALGFFSLEAAAAPKAEGADGDFICTDIVFAPAPGDTTTVYRIPAIIEAKNGDILAFAEKRMTGESDNGNISIVMRRSSDGGVTWGEEKILWDNHGMSFNNPQPVVDAASGKIVILITPRLADDSEEKIEKGESLTSMSVSFATSDDNGETWTGLTDITSIVKPLDWTWYTTGPGHAIQIETGPHKGRLIFGCDHKTYDKQADSVHWFSHCIYTDDLGQNWKVGGTPLPEGGNESTICELADGKLMMNMRHRDPAGTRRLVSISDDGGDTWSEVTEQKGLIEPRCEGSILNYHAAGEAPSNTLLFSNPRSRKGRNKVSISISRDGGNTWPEYLLVHQLDGAYTDLVNLPSGAVGIIYETISDSGKYQDITFMRIPSLLITKNYGYKK